MASTFSMSAVGVHVVMAMGRRPEEARPTRAGLKMFEPRPPKSCLPKMMAAAADDAVGAFRAGRKGQRASESGHQCRPVSLAPVSPASFRIFQDDELGRRAGDTVTRITLRAFPGSSRGLPASAGRRVPATQLR